MIGAVLLAGAAAAAGGGAPQQIAPAVTPAAAARTDQVATASGDTGMEQLPPDARAVRQPVAGRPVGGGPVAGRPTRAASPDDPARTYAAVVAQDGTLDAERLVRAVGPETLSQLVTEIGKPGDTQPGDPGLVDLKSAIAKGVVVIGPTKP